MMTDISGFEIAQEIQNLPSVPSQMTALQLLSLIHKKQLQELYLKLWITLKKAVMPPDTVASAERTFQS